MNITWRPSITPIAIWLPPLNKNPGNIDTHHSTNKLHLSSQWNWSNIFGKIARITPEGSNIRQIKGKHRLERKIVHRDSTEVGLQKRYSPIFNARICTCSTTLFPKQKNRRPQDSKYPWTQPIYGKNNHMLSEEEPSEELDDNNKKIHQKCFGNFLYYARSIDPTTLIALK